MADGQANLGKLTVIGQGTCVGGAQPNPPLDGFPGLCWMPDHPVFGNRVFTDDQKASVFDIAVRACEQPDQAALAAQFGTTPARVADAINYALKAGFLRQ